MNSGSSTDRHCFSTTDVTIPRELLLDKLHGLTHDVLIACLLLMSSCELTVTLSSPICARVVDVASSGNLDAMLSAVLHSLDTVAVLACVLDALVHVANIYCFELIPL